MIKINTSNYDNFKDIYFETISKKVMRARFFDEYESSLSHINYFVKLTIDCGIAHILDINEISDDSNIDNLLVLNNFRKIILASSDQMKRCCIILRDSYPKSLDDKDKKFIIEFAHKCRNLLFSTKFKDNKTSQQYSFKEMIVGISDVKNCPYCGKEFISHNPFTGVKDSSGIHIDHFYSVRQFPFFCLSLFNLVPCCLSCNVMKADRIYEDLESPFFDAYVRHVLSYSESKGLVKDYYEDVIRNSELINQPKEVIEEFLSVTDKLPINEYKVVLIGDGGAGKTLTLSRMIHEGEYITDFNGDSTPGICISNETIKIDNESIHVNYWDFGGQEVLHSMHRMFMTKRAVYIVFLNARYNTQDDRAKYWLHNMNYYESQNSPVVIVLNQMDQNPYALLNESGLKRLYPNLKRIIRISALNDKPDKILELKNAIIEEIKEIMNSSMKIPVSWFRLIERLRENNDSHINLRDFNRICIEEKIDISDDYQIHLIDMFSQMGVCFYCKDSISTQDNVVLNPIWLTNALSGILFNGRSSCDNGIISHEKLFELLTNKDLKVISATDYTRTELMYIISVTRQYGLSYRINDGVEFLPMLCTPNQKLTAKDVVSDEWLHFVFRYDYLPKSVFYQLLVGKAGDLDYKTVSQYSALLYSQNRKMRAFLEMTDDELNVYSHSEDQSTASNVYMNEIFDVISHINQRMGLVTNTYVSFRADGIESLFLYEYLMRSKESGLNKVFSMELNRVLDINDIVNRYKNEDEIRQKDLFDTVIRSLRNLQNARIYLGKDVSENDKNAYVRDQIEASHRFICYDETHRGISETGIKAGSLDIMIRDQDYKDLAIYEGEILKGKSFTVADKKYYDGHVNKLLYNYNQEFLKHLYLVSYVSWDSGQFEKNWIDYQQYVISNINTKYKLEKHVLVDIGEGELIRCLKAEYNCGLITLSVYHIVVRIA